MKKTIDDKFRPDELEALGFTDIQTKFGYLDIWMKGDKRVLYNRPAQRVHHVYDYEKPSQRLSIQQVTEVLQAAEHFREIRDIGLSNPYRVKE